MGVGNVNLVILIRGKEKDLEKDRAREKAFTDASEVDTETFLTVSLCTVSLHSTEMSGLAIHET